MEGRDLASSARWVVRKWSARERTRGALEAPEIEDEMGLIELGSWREKHVGQNDG